MIPIHCVTPIAIVIVATTFSSSPVEACAVRFPKPESEIRLKIANFSNKCIEPALNKNGPHLLNTSECLGNCGGKGGECKQFCGPNGYCCKRGVSGECPSKIQAVAYKDHHACVIQGSTGPSLKDIVIASLATWLLLSCIFIIAGIHMRKKEQACRNALTDMRKMKETKKNNVSNKDLEVEIRLEQQASIPLLTVTSG